jgi:hypothetical protein
MVRDGRGARPLVQSLNDDLGQMIGVGLGIAGGESKPFGTTTSSEKIWSPSSADSAIGVEVL